MSSKLRILPHGDSAADIVLDNVISPEVNARVHAIGRQILLERREGILGCIPGYRTLTVEYDPLRLTYGQVCMFLRALPEPDAEVLTGKRVRIPVCYGGAFGPDLQTVAEYAGLTEKEVIRRHAAPEYHVYMLGFRPGFPYLGGLDDTIACPRRAVPREKVERGSVGIAGRQTGVYPESSPGGWNLIGRTPVCLFDEKKGSRIQPGDTVCFIPVDSGEYERLEKTGGWCFD